MRDEKQNLTAYSSLIRNRGFSGSTNILDLIKKNKEEERKEKVWKIYTLLASFAGLILVLGMFIYL